jgi:TRAP-type transport system periplasmic protein
MPPDMYMNLDKGVVNGTVTGLGMIHDYKIPEIVDYYLGVDLGSGVFPTIINKEFYNAMTDEDKKIFQQSIDDFAKISAESSIKAHNDGLNDIKASGKAISPLTAEEKAAWDKAGELAVQKWKDDCVKSGVDISVANKVLASWTEIYKKFSKK